MYKVAGKCKVKDLRVGQRVDLENDMVADPDAYLGGESSHPEFQSEFETVMEMEQETPNCIRVDFVSGFSCGFPNDHEVDIDAEQDLASLSE